MASRAPDSSGRSKKLEGDPEREGIAALPEVLSRLKLQILDSRATSIKEKLAENAKKLEACTSQLSTLANSRRDVGSMDQTENKNMLSMRTANALCKIHGSDLGYGEKENMNCQEELPSSVIVFENSSSGKCTVRPIKLPFVEKIPPYTTWMFLDRNQKMAEDQSVVGRRQIYYDQQGSETLICSDSEGDAEPEEEKRDFSEGEDQILWKAIHDHGSDPEVFSVLRQFINATDSEIEERYEVLHKRWQENQSKCSASSGDKEFERVFLEKTLTGALDSFDNLFCRRCLVFDCRPHGGSQNLILPSEKQPFSIESEDSRKPCSNGCYLWGGFAKDSHSSISEKQPASLPEKVVVPLSLTEGENRGRSATPAINLHVDIASELLTSNAGKRKNLEHYSSVQENSKILPHTGDKQKKKTKQDVVITDAENQQDLHHGSIWECYNNENHEKPKEKSSQSSSKMDISPSVIDANRDGTRGIEFERKGLTSEVSCSSDSCKRHPQSWKPIEKDLYMKGLEIFGKNSCLIARNLLSGLKTCKEIADYMFNDGISMLNRPLSSKLCSEIDVSDPDYMDQQQMPARTRIWRRRGRARKLKYTWKSAGHPSIRKRIADGKERCKQYVPCGCQQMCSKQCPCLENATCCEKYCGCSKSCKNRFRGCHCAKSQCRSRQCPCFAAGRECDPDVCRNCWVSCGDGSIDAPPPRGDGYQCGNMKLLLKQQQRILLGRSDVAGWGAFIKNPVNKNDYLGEYTGELISHKEADKRGKIYDRANSSFLFDLNDEFVLDAYRKGDKLKFANHSSNPNCYAKIMLVAGDHRVGIFAKEHIDASEELFYDYRYGPDQAPTWARKPEGSKRDDATSSNTRRAHKVA